MYKCLRVLILILGVKEIIADGVKLSVYYEALCPDSIKFVETQLFPTYKYIGNYLKVDLVPFGFATVTNDTGKINFECQHGPKECYGNEIHSCAIALYSVEESTEFVYCAMSSNDSTLNSNLEKCANTSGISWKELQTCYSSGQADKLLEANGVRTNQVQPAITFIPTIVFNDHFNTTLQNEAVEDLLDVVCKFLDYEPIVCTDDFNNKIQVNLV